MRLFSLLSLWVSGAGLIGCGEPLDALPDDTVAVVFIDAIEEQQGGFASLRFDNASCLQLSDGTSFLFNGIAPDEARVGGRGNNPLAAYLAVSCEPPSATWFQLARLPDPPFVFEVASGDISLVVEIDEAGAVTRCDFPSCASESSTRPPPVVE